LILVTGAGGKTGRSVARALADRNVPVRAFIRSDAYADRLRATASELHVGDMSDASSLAVAMRGVHAVYHIAPNMHGAEVRMAQDAIAAAERAGVSRFVFHSVLRPAVEAMPHHWRKMRAEEALFASSLEWTILQPTAYFQNLLAMWPQILEGEHRVPYPVTTRISMVDLEDVAAVAVRVLLERGHAGAVYELCGSESEVADRLSAALDRTVRAAEIPLAVWSREAGGRGLPRRVIEDLVRMFGYYADHGLRGNPRVLEALLGRPPARLDDFLRRATVDSDTTDDSVGRPSG